MSRSSNSVVNVDDLGRWPIYYELLRAEGFFHKYPCKIEAKPSSLLNQKITLYKGDITKLKIGAIVNAANNGLWAGGGICGAIFKAAGRDLEKACNKLGKCPTGQTVLTPGFNLPADYILHSVGPTDGDGNDLASCYKTSLELCKLNKIRSLAFCCISTGIFGFPNRAACLIALRTVRKWLEFENNHEFIDRIVFCVFLNEDDILYKQFIPALFPVPIPEPSDLPSSNNDRRLDPTEGSSGSGSGKGSESLSSTSPDPVEGKSTPASASASASISQQESASASASGSTISKVSDGSDDVEDEKLAKRVQGL